MADGSSSRSCTVLRGWRAAGVLCLWACAIFGFAIAGSVNSTFAAAAVFLASALLGSIPWGVIISKVFFHTDIREHGSGNIGTTNALRTMGKAGGAAVFLLDFGKGLASGGLALAACWLLVPGGGLSSQSPVSYDLMVTLAFLGCIWGHVFSPWLGFKGGKGIAVAVGCLFATFGWIGALLELALFAIVVAATRRVSAGSLAAALACPFFALALFWGEAAPIALCTLAAFTVIWAHRGNIARLRAGTESRIGGRKA
ncbi:acyl-phosphate glycerol 3-phosphate acyltransferase [Gordonibacter sp. An230]|uniref:glycerol-3-phosphate acyltransferase n=1 Tax=Gordonibacter sp. An230 TaxID=1965592 RepID=UPI000B3AA5FB|nr:glycerol-3-phosphate acyltransferase [Gordonibacter sp. An230]OUO90692.1 acyl-phosphate glycerol 3-phosphate acyltransferase [Gordonibacter sp. An230]